MSTHTPGPWAFTVVGDVDFRQPEYDDFAIVADSGLCPGIVWGASWKEGEANARLLAAAPDLLEACKVASALLKGVPRSLGYDFDARQLDAAIAKATQP